MKRMSLKLLASLLVIGSLVAWFRDPTRRIDWIPLFIVGIAVSMVDVRVGDLEARLRALESAPKGGA